MDDEFPDGYYWALHEDGTYFVVLRQSDHWYTVGVVEPIDWRLLRRQIVGAIAYPVN